MNSYVLHYLKSQRIVHIFATRCSIVKGFWPNCSIFNAQRGCVKQIQIEFCRHVTHFPWSCHNILNEPAGDKLTSVYKKNNYKYQQCCIMIWSPNLLVQNSNFKNSQQGYNYELSLSKWKVWTNLNGETTFFWGGWIIVHFSSLYYNSKLKQYVLHLYRCYWWLQQCLQYLYLYCLNTCYTGYWIL